MIPNNFLSKITKLEITLGYHFTNKHLLVEALTHPSLKQNNKLAKTKSSNLLIKEYFDYERLELFGDSILNFVITEILYLDFHHHNEGKLAKIRSQLICTEALHKIALKLNLSDYILMTSGEENSNGRNNPHNLENVIEALLAAIYLDSNMEEVKKVIRNLWDKTILEVDIIKSDPKSTLQEWSQSKHYGLPIYETIEVAGSAHEPIYTIKVSVQDKYEIGTGRSIKSAEKEASKKLLDLLEIK